jgi:hypothetical protein
MGWAFHWVRAMIEQILKIEIERRKMFSEFARKSFPEAEVEEKFLPQMNASDGWILVIRIKNPNCRSLIIRPRRQLMTETNNNFLQVFFEGIQTARHLLSNPPLIEEDFQGTILLTDNGVERFLTGGEADSGYL